VARSCRTQSRRLDVFGKTEAVGRRGSGNGTSPDAIWSGGACALATDQSRPPWLRTAWDAPDHLRPGAHLRVRSAYGATVTSPVAPSKLTL
jgi:hypothetical protein